MKKTVRDLIVDACDEARLVNRSQPIPGSIFNSALILLQKRAAQYSNTNLLSFTRKEVNFTTDKTETIIGDVVPDAAFPDVIANRLQEIVRVYVRPKGSTSESWTELDFIAYEDFYNYGYTNTVYSVLPLDETHVKLFLKKPMLEYEIKVIYNEMFDFDQDTEFNIPRQFIALFTAGLVYDLACQYPRLSDSTVMLLKDRLTELEENVRRSSSVNKFIGRDIDTRRHWSYADGIMGRFLV